MAALACDILPSAVPTRVPVRNRWYTKSKQIEELIKWQFITIRAGLKEAKGPGTARHPRGQ